MVRSAARGFERASPGWLLWLAISSLAAILLIFGLVLYASRLDTAAAARTESLNVALVINDNIARNLELVDLSLQAARDGASRPEVMQLAPALKQTLLFDRAATTRSLGALLVTDASGHVIADSRSVPAHELTVVDQDFFRRQAATKDLGLFISEPLLSPIDGAWCLALSRRITLVDGSFGGVVFGILKLTFLRELLDRLNLGPKGAFVLAGTDGTILVRQPFDARVVGRPITLPPMKQSLSGPNEGFFEGLSRIDGVRRQFFFKHVEGWPLVQFLGRSTEDIYAAWWRRTEWTCLGVLLLGATILGLVAYLQVELRRRIAAEAELAVLATTDSLTGLANRRRFDAMLAREWRRACRTSQPVALLMLDVDHFKTFNDHFGHQGGDAVLVSLAERLRQASKRPSDLPARYGGEEFVVLLPDTSADNALAVAREIRALVLALAQPHPGSATGRLSVSIGVASMVPPTGSSEADLVRLADKALYDAKKAGRDCAMLVAPDALMAA